MAGEALPVWACAEAIAAETASALPSPAPSAATERLPRASRPAAAVAEHGLRHVAWRHLPWSPVRATLPGGAQAAIDRLADGLDGCTPHALDARFRAAIALLQSLDLELGRILRQLVDRRLYRELGFESFERYVAERLGLSARTARRLVRMARAEHSAPAVANAFRAGRITGLQAEVLLRGGSVEWAARVTLRRLEDELPERSVVFWAPRSVAALFEVLRACVGLEAMLDHAIATWLEAGARFRDYADFERDDWRCTVPGCTARRNLQSHHLRFRSAGGPDRSWNRTTLCAFHHQRGVHGGTVSIVGRAPHRLVYALGLRRGAPPLARYRSGDRLMA
jgi:hypothetical protein